MQKIIQLLFICRWYALALASIFCLVTGYWWFFVYPYLWIHSGHVNATSVEIAAPETGTVIEVLAQEGNIVHPQTILFTLENLSIKEHIQSNQTALIKLHEEEFFYKNQSEAAMQDYLSDLGVRSQKEVDQHLQKLQSAQAKIGQIQEQVALLAKEQNRLQQQQTTISVVSPLQGVVMEQKKESGNRVQKEDSVLSLYDTNSCWVETTVSEKDLRFLKLGQSVDVYLTAYPHQVWQGTISWIAPATLSKTQKTSPSLHKEAIAIKINLLPKELPIKPGLSAKVRIKLAS